MTFGKKNCMVLKTAFRVSTRFFWGKFASIKNLIPDFFEPSAENFSKFREVFSGLLSICNQCFQRSLLEEYMKFEITFDNLWHKFLAWVSFLLSTCPGEPLRKKMPQKTIFLPLSFRAGNFSDFWGIFFRQGCQTCNLCDWRSFVMERFFEKTGRLYDYSQKLTGRLMVFLSSFLAALLKLHSTCAEEHTEEKPSFQKEKSALFSDFDPQKNNSEEKTRYVRKNCPYLVKRTFGATFFQNVISGIIIFRSSAKYFLPPLERVWHGCENGILRDQSTVKGAYCFKVHKLKLFNNFMPRAEEHETIGLIFWHDFQICIFFDQIKNGLKILFFICFRTLSVVFFGFWWTIFRKGCQICNLCLQKSFFKRW